MTSLLEVAELVLHPPDQCGRDVCLLELLGELSPGEYFPFRKTGTHSFPPTPCGVGEVVGGIQDLLVVATTATARLFSMVRSQSSASKGSFVRENTGGLVF